MLARAGRRPRLPRHDQVLTCRSSDLRALTPVLPVALDGGSRSALGPCHPRGPTRAWAHGGRALFHAGAPRAPARNHRRRACNDARALRAFATFTGYYRLMRRFGRRRQDLEIAPDEIFLDTEKGGIFDRARFEGRIEQPLSGATYLGLTMVLVLALSTLGVRAVGDTRTPNSGPSLATSRIQRRIARATTTTPRRRAPLVLKSDTTPNWVAKTEKCLSRQMPSAAYTPKGR